MRASFVDLLRCPECGGALIATVRSGTVDRIEEGTLACSACGSSFPITHGIPRFVPAANYASSFGYQWNHFRTEQLDPQNGTGLSELRVVAETDRTSADWSGVSVLDVGCGAGRFLEVVSRTARLAVGMDFSTAVDAARANLADRDNVELVQADVYRMPFQPGAFDEAYCIGVLQHTPNPALAMEKLAEPVRPGGSVALTAYERRRWTKLSSKYLLRPLTTRLPAGVLLGAIQILMPVLFPLTSVLFRIPVVGRFFRAAVPVANYVDNRDLTRSQRYRWAVMDTFDMLAPAFDQPQTMAEVGRALERGGIADVRRLPNPGLNVIGRKRA